MQVAITPGNLQMPCVGISDEAASGEGVHVRPHDVHELGDDDCADDGGSLLALTENYAEDV